MKTPVVNGRHCCHSTGTRSTSLVRVLQKLYFYSHTEKKELLILDMRNWQKIFMSQQIFSFLNKPTCWTKKKSLLLFLAWQNFVRRTKILLEQQQKVFSSIFFSVHRCNWGFLYFLILSFNRKFISYLLNFRKNMTCRIHNIFGWANLSHKLLIYELYMSKVLYMLITYICEYYWSYVI